MRMRVDDTNSFLVKRIHKEVQYEHDLRSPFQRDRDRIMHSRAFRRMMHKTQIFNSNKGDHYRNRLTHTLEVSQIARSIGKVLNLNDELIEAISFGHDLGHTPYGHVGERTLDDIIKGKIIDSVKIPNDGFKHNLQSLRVVDELETRCADYYGINLTLAVREGIVKHTKVKKDDIIVQLSNNDYTYMNMDCPFSFTFEGQVVALSDEIAQFTHDLEDSVRSKIIRVEDVMRYPLIAELLDKKNITVSNYKNVFPDDPAFYVITLIIHDYIDLLIRDVIASSKDKVEEYLDKYKPDYTNVNSFINEKCIMLSSDIEKRAKEVNHEIDDKVISSEFISVADSKSEYMITQLFKAFYKHPKQLPDYVLTKFYSKKGTKLNRMKINEDYLKSDYTFIRTICDHIAGMTDQFASREYGRLYIPD